MGIQVFIFLHFYWATFRWVISYCYSVRSINSMHCLCFDERFLFFFTSTGLHFSKLSQIVIQYEVLTVCTAIFMTKVFLRCHPQILVTTKYVLLWSNHQPVKMGFFNDFNYSTLDNICKLSDVYFWSLICQHSRLPNTTWMQPAPKYSIPSWLDSKYQNRTLNQKTGKYLCNKLSIIDYYKHIRASEFYLYIRRMEWEEKEFIYM